MEFQDYYQRLGIAESADAAEIKKAYRKLARKYHPDVSSEDNAEEKFKEVKEAYEVLKDPEKRAEYDQLKAMGGIGPDNQYQPPPGWESNSHFSEGGFTQEDMGQYSDFFDSIFSQRGAGGEQPFRCDPGQSYQSRGEDAHYKMAVFLEDLYNGAEKIIEVSLPSVDPRGFVTSKTKKLKVKIPPGMAEGQHIRLKGQGGLGLGGGDSGDLFVEIQLAPHPRYRVVGKDVYCNLDLLPWEAALGGSIELQTPTGKVKLKVTENSQSGQKYRLTGKGLPGKAPGNLVAEVNIVLPPEVTDDAIASYHKLSDDYAYNPRV